MGTQIEEAHGDASPLVSGYALKLSVYIFTIAKLLVVSFSQNKSNVTLVAVHMSACVLEWHLKRSKLEPCPDW